MEKYSSSCCSTLPFAEAVARFQANTFHSCRGAVDVEARNRRSLVHKLIEEKRYIQLAWKLLRDGKLAEVESVLGRVKNRWL